MTREWICTGCHSRLGIEHTERLHLKNKSEQVFVGGEDFIVTKICRRCGTRNEMRHQARP